MKLLEAVTPPPIYHGCSTQKTFWEEKFILGDFKPVNMKNDGRRNFRINREIKNGEKYITLDNSLTFGSLDKTKITYLESKYYLWRSGKGLITLLGLKTIVRSNKKKSYRYAINNVSMEDISKIIKEFEKLPYKGYVRKSLKH